MHTTLVDCATVHAALGRADHVVVDCRFDLTESGAGRRAYAQAHIPGAVYAHMEEDLSAPRTPDRGRHPLPTPEKLRTVFGRLGIGRASQVFAYDNAGGMLAAARLWWLLRYMGHEAVAVLDGGWAAWQAAALPRTSGIETRGPVAFEGFPRMDRVVAIDSVPAVKCLIDSRDPVRFRGEAEPIDPVAGHIPGAVNYFCKTNLDDGGRFRPRAVLRGALAGVFGDAAPEEAVFYCGSGVSACHNILATVHAGYPEPRLYAGSWSEWCADPARPVATGGDGPQLASSSGNVKTTDLHP